jgi:hypothetical protein
MARDRKKYQVLGDSDLEEEALEIQEPLQEEEELQTVHNVEQVHFPEDVWDAAVNSPDQGRAVLQTFNELHTTR